MTFLFVSLGYYTSNFTFLFFTRIEIRIKIQAIEAYVL